MRIMLQEYVEAKAKLEKVTARSKELQSTIRTWDDASKQHGKPPEGYEITAFIIHDDGEVEAQTRKIPVKAAVAS